MDSEGKKQRELLQEELERTQEAQEKVRQEVRAQEGLVEELERYLAEAQLALRKSQEGQLEAEKDVAAAQEALAKDEADCQVELT